jgi:hypothetical protein
VLAAVAVVPALAISPAHADAPDVPVGVSVTSEKACVTISKMVPQCVPLHWS